MQSTAQRIHAEQGDALTGGVAKIVSAAAYSMKATDHLVWCDATDNVVVITLPSLEEGAGKFYCVVAINATNDVSVTKKEDATEISTYGDLDTAEDSILVYSDGREWLLVGTRIT